MLALIPCTFTIYITISYDLQKINVQALVLLCLLILHGYGGLVILFFIRLKPLLPKVETNKQYHFATNKGCKPLFSRLEQVTVDMHSMTNPIHLSQKLIFNIIF